MNNPVIIRETTVRLRMVSSFLFLTIILLICLIFVLLNWHYLQERFVEITFDVTVVRRLFFVFNLALGISVIGIVPFRVGKEKG